MCGRYVSTRSSTDLATLFDAADYTEGQLDRSFNLAPTDSVPIIRMSRSADTRVVSAARWGLVPPWSDSLAVGVRMINARSESVTTSRAYRSPFARKRCLVPADGWFEWQKLGNGRKQPYYTTAKEDRPLVFAGLWEAWGGDEKRLLTCTVLTTQAVGELHEIHDRMPLLLEPDSYRDWLDDRDAAEHLLRGVDEQSLKSLEIRPVGKAVGNVANDGPQLVERVDVLEPPPAVAKEEQQETLF